MSNVNEIAKNAKYVHLDNGDLYIENAAILQGARFKNFSGNPTDVNPQGGKRTFDLVLDEEMADILSNEGWNIKRWAPREEGEDYTYFTEIVVNLASKYPPKVCLVTNLNGVESMSQLDEVTISRLDKVQLKDIVLTIHPFEHGRKNAAGATVKGYLRSFYATEDNNNDLMGAYRRFV